MKKKLVSKTVTGIMAAAMAMSVVSGTAFAAPPADGQSQAAESAEGQSPEGQAPAGESAEGQSPEGQAPAGESAEGQSPEGQAPAGDSAGGPGGPGGGGGGPQMAFVSEGMTAATESIIKTTTDKEGNETEAYSLTGYNRAIDMNDGTKYYFDKDDLYIGYAIKDGLPVAADSNMDISAVENENGIYKLNLKDIVIGDKYTEVYLNGEGSTADITGLLVMESMMEEGQSGRPYKDAEGHLITPNSDMSAAGAGIVATNGGKAYIHDLSFTSNGFVHSLAIAWGDGEHSTVIDIRNSDITTLGANPITQTPEGFLLGGLDFNTMICPPWVLGLFGGTRSINILNEKATLNVIDSTVTSAGWAILSSDSCTDPVFNVVDSTLKAAASADGYGLNSEGFVDGGFDILGIDGYEIDGTTYPYGVAYGTYAIGGSREYLYGTQVLGTTYATISTESTETNYYSSNGTINIVDAIDYDAEAGAFTNVAETVEGKGDVSRIYSVFGFMSHGNGDIGVYDGTEVNTEDAVFLYRNGDLKYTVDSAVINAESGVILQMMDNDDAQAGGPVAQELTDNAGLPTELYVAQEGDSNAGSHMVEFELANGTYAGDFYNATGWMHNDTFGQDADTLNLVIDNAELTGAVTKSKTVHATPYHEGIEEEIAARNAVNAQYGYSDIQYVYLNEAMEVVDDASEAAYVQFTYFTKLQYYLLGQVENMSTADGKAIIDVELKNGAVWNVTEPCYITTLTVDDSSVVNGIVTEMEGYIFVEPAEGTVIEGESPEGESPEGESPEGESPEGESPEGESPEGESPEGESPVGEAPAEASADSGVVEVNTVSDMAGDITVEIYYETVDGQKVITDVIDKGIGLSIMSLIPDITEFYGLLDEALAK